MALVQLTNALKLVIVEKVHVHSGTAAALATRPLHERGLGKHERSIGTLKQTVAVVKKPLFWPPRPRGRLVLLYVGIGSRRNRSGEWPRGRLGLRPVRRRGGG